MLKKSTVTGAMKTDWGGKSVPLYTLALRESGIPLDINVMWCVGDCE